jgi:O-methyltransferase involved in polyketide biosynthesis
MITAKAANSRIESCRRVFLRRAVLGRAALAVPRGGILANAFALSAAAALRLVEGAPSVTAQGAAVLRALHQVIDYPRILEDPLALPIIGRDGERALQAAVDRQAHGLRAFVALRSRYAEDRLAAAVARGVRQYVVLGAGLDTFACRIVFEFSLPESQLSDAARSSRGRSVARMAKLGEPWLTIFEPEALADGLRAAGFNGVDTLQPADANLAYFSGRADSLRIGGSGRIAAARV